LSKDGLDFRLNFSSRISLQETHLLDPNPRRWGNIPAALQKRLQPARFHYALVGLKDNIMADILPPGSLVEIDKTQLEVQHFAWKWVYERPLYLVRHPRGYSCCWCQLDGSELTLIPHPLSQCNAMHLVTPQEAVVLGKAVNMWVPRQLHNMHTDSIEGHPFAAYSGFAAMFESGRAE